MEEVPFNKLEKGHVYYIEFNSSIDPTVDRTIKRKGIFDKYYTVEYDDEELTIANFKNLQDILKSKSKSKDKSKDNSHKSSVTGFTEDAKFFIPNKDRLMMKSIINQRTKSSLGTDISKYIKYGGDQKRTNHTATKKNKLSNRKTMRRSVRMP